ncbi:hypothetical protein BGW38_002187 [Lunasporangiospora selenospora]|uniref:Kelch motif-containing protein n=1 Tax=Lunasporangiospora selenospora TaxID=979761 RepID=A0A9P6FSE9_9FUNG|nr:hypothetical protein BGW38_002187 [Lunasporangiospora selenospora]
MDPDSDRYYFYGGIDDNFVAYPSLYLLDLPARNWTVLSMKGDLRFISACAVTNRAFVAWGGKSNSTSSPVSDFEPIVFDLKEKAWTKKFVVEYIPPPPKPKPKPTSTSTSTSTSLLPPPPTSPPPVITPSPIPNPRDGGSDGSIDNKEEPSSAPVDQDQGGLNTVAIAGGVGGGAVFISLVAFIFCLRQGYKKRQKDDSKGDPPRRLTQGTRPRDGRRGSWSSGEEEDLKTRRSEYRKATHSREEEYADDFRIKESSSFLGERSGRDLAQTWRRQRQDSFSDRDLRSSKQKGFSYRNELDLSGARSREMEERSSTMSGYRSLENRQDLDYDWDRRQRTPARNETTRKKQQEPSIDGSERHYSRHLDHQSTSESQPSPTAQRSHLKSYRGSQPRDPQHSSPIHIGLQFDYVQPNDPQYVSEKISTPLEDLQYIDPYIDSPPLAENYYDNQDIQHSWQIKSQRRDPQDGVTQYFNPSFGSVQPGNPQTRESQRGSLLNNGNQRGRPLEAFR